MKKEQDELTGISKLTRTLTEAKNKISDAYQEARRQIAAVNDTKVSLSCLKARKMDFGLIEEDIKRIHEKLVSDGLKVLGSHLIIDDKEDTVEIKTYLQQDEKTFLDTIKFKVESISNLPSNLLAELEKNRKVELHLEIDS